MQNTLEYIISLKDLVSSKLQKIVITNDEALGAFAKMEKLSNQVSQSFKNMGTSVYTLKQKLDLLQQERDLLPAGSMVAIRKYNSEINRLTGQIQKLQTLNGSRVGNWAKQAVSSLPAFATNPLVLAGAGMGAAVRKGMEADMQKANMLTLFRGNEQAAKDMYSRISQYAIKSPYEKADLIESQKTMMGFGISAEQGFGTLKQIGDIAMGDAQKMQSLTLAFSQATSAGKLQGQDLLQMINAGFNPLNIISERTGESMASLKDRMSKGTLSAGELAKAFEWATDKQGLFYKGAEKAGETLGGKWSTLVDSFNEMLLSVYSAISPILMPLIKAATAALDTLGGGIKWVVDKIKEGDPWVRGIAVAIGLLGTALLLYNGYVALTTMFQNGLTMAVIQSNLAFLMSPVFWIIAGIVALIAAIAYVVYAYDGWGKSWDGLMGFLSASWELFKNHFTIQWLSVRNAFLDGIDLMQIAWYKFKSLWDEDGANAGLAKLNNDAQARASELAAANQVSTDLIVKAAASWDKIGLTKNNKTLGDVKSGLMGKLGISPMSQTGGETPGTKDAPITPGSKTAASEAVNGGQRNIHITIGKVVETLAIHVVDTREAATELHSMVRSQIRNVFSEIEATGA